MFSPKPITIYTVINNPKFIGPCKMVPQLALSDKFRISNDCGDEFLAKPVPKKTPNASHAGFGMKDS